MSDNELLRLADLVGDIAEGILKLNASEIEKAWFKDRVIEITTLIDSEALNRINVQGEPT